jgi:hypothetical protein
MVLHILGDPFFDSFPDLPIPLPGKAEKIEELMEMPVIHRRFGDDGGFFID